MPYRSDSRDDAERRLHDARTVQRDAEMRVRSTAASLRRLRARFEQELADADRAVSEAEAAWRKAVRHGLAQDGGQHTRVRAALRSAGVVAALEAAMRRKKSPATPSAAKPKPGPVTFTDGRAEVPRELRAKGAEAVLTEARKTRARLTTQREPTLEAAEKRMRDAVLAHDEATEALQAAQARAGELTRSARDHDDRDDGAGEQR